MNLNEVLSSAGRKKARKRVGRGCGSGHGKTCGRGHKGAGQRAGSGANLGYEGGQTSAFARIPQRGFNNANFRTAYQVVNVSDLEVFDDGARVDVNALVGKGLVRRGRELVKILGNGRLSRKLNVAAHAFSSSAAEKIRAAGGSVERVE